MSRTCTICEHPNRDEIDHLIVNGNTFRNIAEQFSLSLGAIHRHKSDHLSQTLTKAKEAEEVAHADNLLEQVRGLQERALEILSKAEEEGDLRTALTAIREARGNLELLARLLGELKEGQTVNVLITPEWTELRTLILEALERYPEARISVSRALESLTNGSTSQ